MMCSKLHCQTGLRTIIFSYKDTPHSEREVEARWQAGREAEVARQVEQSLYEYADRVSITCCWQVTRLEEDVARSRKGAREASDLAHEKRLLFVSEAHTLIGCS